MRPAPPSIPIPAEMKPADGRFGSGPSKVRPDQIEGLAARNGDVLGTSHRQLPVKFLVAELRNGLAELLNCPDGYEIVLGNGGTHAFWDALVAGFIENQSQHLAFGEFSAKFARGVEAAPFLAPPQVIESEPGTRPVPVADPEVDTYALTHNETSTGVATDIVRPDDAGLVAVDATSAAGGLRVDLAQCDVYYFSPQKVLAADGGLWLAAMSPAAIERVDRVAQTAAATGRWVPPSLSLPAAVENSRKDQTLNTPALATLSLAADTVGWILSQGGLEWSAGRCDRSAEIIYGWADAHQVARPFVADPAARSHVVATIDFDESVDAKALAAELRANDIVDTEPYRKLGRNQLRVALFPSIDPEDVEALTACIDYLLERL